MNRAKTMPVPDGREDMLRRAVEEITATGKGVVITDQDENPVAVILAPHTHRAQAVINQEEGPATDLAIAEDERHTLLAQAAREHRSRMEAEIRRYAGEIEHIESVFRDRTRAQTQVPEWVTVNRRADIAQALRLVDAASVEDVGRLIRKAGLDTDFHGLRLGLARAASEPGAVYPAWVAADKILRAAR